MGNKPNNDKFTLIRKTFITGIWDNCFIPPIRQWLGSEKIHKGQNVNHSILHEKYFERL